jgi:phospholipid transport system transporter-binding protein
MNERKTAPPQLHCVGDTLEVVGTVNMHNARQVLQHGQTLLGQHVIRQVDLTGVTEADSACVSVMLQWLLDAQARGVALQFIHLPTSVRSLAHLYGVAHWLDESP